MSMYVFICVCVCVCVCVNVYIYSLCLRRDLRVKIYMSEKINNKIRY